MCFFRMNEEKTVSAERTEWKDYFIFPRELFEACESLESPEDKAYYYRSIIEYGITGELDLIGIPENALIKLATVIIDQYN